MRKNIAIGLLILLAWTVVGVLLFQPSVRERVALFLPPQLAVVKPLWKERFRATTLNLLANDESSYLVQCYGCELGECRTSFITSFKKCLQERDAAIPFVMLHVGGKIGKELAECAENDFAKTRGPFLPSPSCDDALVRLHRTTGSTKDPRVFAEFLERFDSWKAVFEANPGSLKDIQQVMIAIDNKDVPKIVEIDRRVQHPLRSRAFLESSDVESVLASFENLLNIMTSSQCSQLGNLGQRVAKGENPVDDLKASVAGVREEFRSSEELDARLIRSLKHPLAEPYTLEELVVLADPALQTLPPEVINMEDTGEDVKQACELMSAIALKYPSWRAEWKEYVARVFGAKM